MLAESKGKIFLSFVYENGVFIFFITSLVILYLVSYYNYLLFHSIAEIFSIVIAAGIFIVVWNARRFEIKSYLVLIGVSFLFVSLLDVFHLLAYKGLGVFPGNTADLATQLWIAMRYLQAFSLLLIPFILNKKINSWVIFIVYSFTAIFLLLSIFYWKIFPICFVDGVGLTPFKKVSEYIITAIFVSSIVIVYFNRKKISDSLRWIILAALFFNALAEIFFTFYTSVFAFSNMLGHLAEILASFLTYKAVIAVGLSRPYDFLFKDLKDTNNFNETLLATIPYGIDIVDEQGNIVFANDSFFQIFGRDASNRKCWQVFKGADEQCRDCPLRQFSNIEELNVSQINDSYFLNGRTYDIFYRGIIYKGKRAMLEVFQDVTERKKIEEKLAHLASFPELNPNPIVELDKSGEIKYLNPAIKNSHPDILDKKSFHPFLADWQGFIDKFKKEKNGVLSREIKVGNFWYDQVISFVPSSNSFRFYCRNITAKKIIEEELIKAKREWEMTFDSVPDLIAIIDKDFRIKRANKAMADKLKLSAGQCIGLNCYNCVHNLNSPLANCPHAKTLQDCQEHFAEIHEDNLGGDFLVSTTPLFDEQGNVSGSVHVARDITDIRKVKTRLQAIFDNSTLGLSIFDQEGTIIDCNESHARIAGGNRDKIIGLNLLNDIQTEGLRKATSECLAGRVGHFQGEHTTVAGGKHLIMKAEFGPIFSPEGKVIGGVQIIEDVTELWKISANLRVIFENSPVGLVLINKDSIIVDCNESHAKIMDGTKEKIIGLNLLKDLKNEGLRRAVKDCLSGKAGCFEGEYTSISGNKTFVIKAEFGPVFSADGKVIGGVQISEDVTRAKEVERAKDEFVSLASHQLRTPLSGISLAAELLLRGISGKLDEGQTGYIKEIFTSAQRMSDLITDLLNVTRIELGTFNIKYEDISLVELTEQVIHDLESQIKKKNLRIEKDFDFSIPEVEFDKNGFNLIIDNLITNAIRYTPEKGRIFVSIKRAGDDVLIKVSDTGCGIPPGEEEKVFKKLYRGSNARDISENGEGLGLYIVKSVADKVGAKVWFEANKQSPGTTFFVTLPIVRKPE